VDLIGADLPGDAPLGEQEDGREPGPGESMPNWARTWLRSPSAPTTQSASDLSVLPSRGVAVTVTACSSGTTLVTLVPHSTLTPVGQRLRQQPRRTLLGQHQRALTSVSGTRTLLPEDSGNAVRRAGHCPGRRARARPSSPSTSRTGGHNRIAREPVCAWSSASTTVTRRRADSAARPWPGRRAAPTTRTVVRRVITSPTTRAPPGSTVGMLFEDGEVVAASSTASCGCSADGNRRTRDAGLVARATEPLAGSTSPHLAYPHDAVELAGDHFTVLEEHADRTAQAVHECVGEVMTRRTTVLVVGAGPCGLAMAAQLSRLGVEVTVVDADDHAHTGSRAILFVAAGAGGARRTRPGRARRPDSVRPAALHYHLSSGSSVRVPLTEVNAPLVLPRSVRRGCWRRRWRPRRQRRVGHQGHQGRPGRARVTVTATRADGSTTEIEADWWWARTGCAARCAPSWASTSRGPVPGRLPAREGRIAGEISTDEIHYFLADTGVALIAPLAGGEFRISGAVPAGTEATAERAQALLDERGPGGLRFTEVRTVTLFSSDERVAGALRSGRCFLVGDAAHVHSPIGGQGLNLGIPDTRNLAWKLAGVVHGRLHESILDSYDPERRAAIAQTLQATGRMARQAVVGAVARRIRDLTWRFAPGLRRAGPRLCADAGGWRSATRTCCSATRPAARIAPAATGTRDPRWIPIPSDEVAGRFQLIHYGLPSGRLTAAAAELADRLPELVAHFPRTADAAVRAAAPDGYVPPPVTPTGSPVRREARRAGPTASSPAATAG